MLLTAAQVIESEETQRILRAVQSNVERNAQYVQMEVERSTKQGLE